MGARHTRLAAAMAACWEAEVGSAERLARLAEQAPDGISRARLLVLAALCRAHASRLLARLLALGRGPLPVPNDDDSDRDLREGLQTEAAMARALSLRYKDMAQTARRQADLSSAWVCELNRSEEEDRSEELDQMIERHSPHRWHDPGLHPVDAGS